MKRPLDVLSEEHFMWATATVLDNGVPTSDACAQG
jgi:hypothetical protein